MARALSTDSSPSIMINEYNYRDGREEVWSGDH